MIALPTAPVSIVSRPKPVRAGAADDRRNGLIFMVERFRVPCVCPDAWDDLISLGLRECPK